MKELRRNISVTILTFVLMLLTLAASFAWFKSSENTINTRITGMLVSEYFHCGSGRKEDPFVITRPIHYYHAVEFFQRQTALPTVYYVDEQENDVVVHFGEEYLYFQIGCPESQLYSPSSRPETDENTQYYVFAYDNAGSIITNENPKGDKSQVLNMAYYSVANALMPMGSSEIPFLGSLNGNMLTIDNLHVVSSSTVNVIDSNGVVRENVVRHTSDMGVFGCVAPGIDINENGAIENDPENNLVELSSIRNLYITNATIDLNGIESTTQVAEGIPTLPDGSSEHDNSFHLVNENGEVVVNGTATPYVGYIAGHVSSTDDITDVYINNCRIVGGPATMSGYGYFGVIVDPTTNEVVSSLGSQIANIYTQGEGSGFGGSIGMTSLFTRIGNIRGNASNIRNITAETVIVDEVAGTTTRVATAYANADAYNTSNTSEKIQYYYDPEAGLYYLYFRGNNNQGYNYLYGVNDHIQTKTVTTITYEKDPATGTYRTVSGYKIYEGTQNYLGMDNSNNPINTNRTNAVTLSFDNSNHLYFIGKTAYTQRYDYPGSDNEDGIGYVDTIYYLNANNNYTGFSPSTSGVTTWAFDESNRLYTVNGNTRYYLDCNNNAWYLTGSLEFSIFDDGSGNYLKITGTSLDSTTLVSEASKIETPNPGASTTLSLVINNNRYYLRSNNGKLELSTNNSNNIWSYDSTKGAYYIVHNTTRYYIVYDGVWKMRAEGYDYLISDGDNYLDITNATSISNSVDPAQAAYWSLNIDASSTTISTIYSGTVTYLGVNNGQLALGANYSSTVWTKDGSAYYTTINGTAFYLSCDNGSWKLGNTGYKIYTGSNYLNAASATAINNVTNAGGSSTWIFDPNAETTEIYTFYNGTKVYLSRNGYSLSLSASSTVWTKESEGVYYITINGLNFYLAFRNNAWFLENEGKKIYSDANYLNASSTTAFNNVTAAENASAWVMDTDASSTTISTYYNGTRTYLGVNNGALALNANYSTIVWNKDGNNYYTLVAGERAYLVYDNGWKVLFDGYSIKNTADNNFLNASSATQFNNQTTAANASVWFLDPNASSTTISAIINGSKTYLGLNNNNELALNASYSGVVWTKDGDTYYVTGSDGFKRYLLYDSGWKVSYDTYKIYSGSNYLRASSNTAIASGNNDSANSSWRLDPDAASTTISVYLNNAFRYLGINNNELALNQSYSNVYWTKDGDSYYTTYDGIDYYLTYQYGAWRVLPKEYVRISMNNLYAYAYSAMYIRNNNNQTDEGKFFRDSAGKYFAFYGNTKYYVYLYTTDNTIRLTTTYANATVWERDGDALYTVVNGERYYLTQTSTSTTANNAWAIPSYRIIGDGDGNYLKLNGTTIENTRNINEAQTFVLSSTTSGTISAQVSGRTYYLRNNNNALELSTTSTTWTFSDGYAINNNRYIAFNGTNWTLATLQYALRYGSSSYMGYTGTNTLSVTTAGANNLVLFDSIPGTGNQTVTAHAGNNDYYLYTGNYGGAVSLSNTTRYWRYVNNGFYYRRNRTSYYLTLNGNTWTTNTTTNSNVTFEPQFVYSTSFIDVGTHDSILIDGTNTYVLSQTYAGAVKNITAQTYAANKNVDNSTASHSAVSKEEYQAAKEITVAERDYIYGLSDTVALNTDYTSNPQKVFSVTSTESGLPTGLTTYIPIRVPSADESDYDANSPYKASLKNTGYIIGGGHYFENNTSVGDIRVSRYPLSNINSYNPDNVTSLYTVDGSGSRNLTANEAAGYISFNDRVTTETDDQGNEQEVVLPGAKSQFDAMIGTAADGLHFMDSEISMNHIITVPQATILNRTYYNYEFPEDCIDFKVLKRGAISFFAGTYFTGNDAFFSLHQIFRDADQKITDIKEIKKIYKLKSAALGSADYIYLYGDAGNDTYGRINQETGELEIVSMNDIGHNVFSYYELAFDTDWITNPLGVEQNNNVYYFEIPCNKGEYALGSVLGKIGAYLLYLDIAANGGDEVGSVVSGQGNDVSTSFKVDFRNPGETSEFAIMQLSVKCPLESDSGSTGVNDRLFEINVAFDSEEDGGTIYPDGIYNIYVKNKIPSASVTLDVFLVDNDNDIMTPFPYAYRIIYTNLTYTEVALTNIAELDFYQSVGSFEIPSEGQAIETSYS